LGFSKPIDFRKVDKTNFRCFQMNDGTVYYGEVAYLRGSDLFLSLEDVPSNNGDEQ